MLSSLKTAVPFAAALALFFYFNPSLSDVVSFLLLGFWLVSFILDAHITLKHSYLISRYETNMIFSFLHSNLGNKSIVFQLLIEIITVFAICYLFTWFQGIRITWVHYSFVSFIFGLAHVEAYLQNKKLLKKFKV